MFTSIENFAAVWQEETKNTAKLLDLLTDESLTEPKHDIIRNLGRAAWHIITTYPEMCNQFGISIKGVTDKDPIPTSAAEIKEHYQKAVDFVLNEVKSWTDEDLQKEDNMYGEVWKRGKSLWVVLAHEIHHRGQMTILMRMAGLKVTGIYGPAQEEWVNYKMDIPAV